MSSGLRERFWETKSLHEMSRQEWESLCDGCGHCCLIKLEDEDTDEVFVTNVACRLLDIKTCRCRDYEQRVEKVASCLILAPDKPEYFKYLPETCAYRCLAEGRPVPDWHPLLSQQINAACAVGVSVQAYAVSEEYIHPDQLSDHVIDK